MPGAPGFQVLAMVRSILLAGLVVLLPISVRAQGHAAMASGGHVMAVAPRPMAHGTPMVTVAPRPANARIAPRSGFVRGEIRPNTPIVRNHTRLHRDFNTADRFRSQQCRSGVPGLGFDEAHLAAVCPNGVGTGFFGQGAGFYSPFFGGGYGGYYMPGIAEGDDSGSADAQQQDTGDVDARDYYGRRLRQAPPAPAVAVAQEQTPVNDSDQFIFVRRDGTVFFAVAYAWENGTLRYVTSDGLRRNIDKNALDLDATQQFNEQRGLSFRLPA